jgi:hypothetical protein
MKIIPITDLGHLPLLRLNCKASLCLWKRCQYTEHAQFLLDVASTAGAFFTSLRASLGILDKDAFNWRPERTCFSQRHRWRGELEVLNVLLLFLFRALCDLTAKSQTMGQTQRSTNAAKGSAPCRNPS